MDKKEDNVELYNFPKTNEEYISVTHDCFRFIDSYRLLSSSLYSLVKTFVNNKHKTLRKMKDEIVGEYNILNIANEIEKLFNKNRYNNDSIEDLQKDFPYETERLDEATGNDISENDPKILKKEVPD